MSSIVEALNGRRTDRLPVWFMRQAGRSLPEYHDVRAGLGMLESCLIPDVAAEITMQPVRRHDVDAAIFFSDIMVPLKLAGVDVEIQPGVGPVLAQPVRDRNAIRALGEPTFEDASAITEALRLVRAELADDKALLGFAGAPFTLAAYMVEGRPSKDHLRARALMHSDPEAWDALMTWCAKISRLFIDVQIAAGVDGVQLFDSWAGSLSRANYAGHVAPYSAMVLADIEVPTIHFGTHTAPLLADMKAAGADVSGVDHRTPLDFASRLVPDTPLQGNIDPAMLFAGQENLHAHARDVVIAGLSAPAHIVNLGHGVPADADAQVITDLVTYLHSLDVTELAKEAS